MPDTNVFLFYPNLIGYARIVLAIWAFWVMNHAPLQAVFLYGLSAALDAFDGWAARTYNQSSRFGAMLDQLTDRCALLAINMSLCVFYPSSAFWFQMSAVIDIASHWLHLHATDLTRKASHKQSSNPILHLYYTDRLFLGFMCGANEAFYMLMYLRAWYPGPSILGVHLMSIFCVLAFPFAFVKAGISLIHLATAAQTVVDHDVATILGQSQVKSN
ncbi:unnamed protein product, partial [Mesorhabditis belari]|uniref:CDP-diacylglycerol--inositol 3-phosphatidyltransferase n=1 Tax=Mesorhabditis belari TaxID=2138241 RepID=A0AAF3FGC1_9BILA